MKSKRRRHTCPTLAFHILPGVRSPFWPHRFNIVLHYHSTRRTDGFACFRVKNNRSAIAKRASLCRFRCKFVTHVANVKGGIHLSPMYRSEERRVGKECRS